MEFEIERASGLRYLRTMRSLLPVKPAPAPPTAPVTAQTLLTATIVSDGSGGFRVIPNKPKQEIPSIEAARMLNVSRGSMSNIIDRPLGQKHLRWRWLTEGKGKRVFDVDSVIAYREALKDLD